MRNTDLSLTTRSMRLFLGGLFVCLAFCGAGRAQPLPITIVSIGDSYASGEGAPQAPIGAGPLWQLDNGDDSCHRSTLAAPAVASRLVNAVRPAPFFHFACSGAKVAGLLGTGGQLKKAVDAVGPTRAIDALIVSIGGDDVNFAALVGSCLITPCDIGLAATTINIAAVVPPRLTTLIAAIRALPVPVRHVFLTAYPLPSSTPLPFPDHLCGSPIAPNIPFHGFSNLLAPRAELARVAVVNPLNAALVAAVASANAGPPGGPVWHFVSRTGEAFNGHGYCMGWPNPLPHMWVSGRYVNTVVDSLNIQSDIFGSMHPNAAGYAAMGAEIAAAVLANVPVVMPPSPTPAKLPIDPLTRLCKQQPTLPVCKADRDHEDPKPDRGPIK